MEVPHGQSLRRLTGQRLDRAIIAVLAVALAYFVIDKFWLSQRITTQQPAASVALATAPGAAAISDKSVTVLTFLDMSSGVNSSHQASTGLSHPRRHEESGSGGVSWVSHTLDFVEVEMR